MQQRQAGVEFQEYLEWPIEKHNHLVLMAILFGACVLANRA
jgi:hypothetical protein